MKGELTRSERRWRRFALFVLIPVAVVGALLLYAMSDAGAVRVLY